MYTNKVEYWKAVEASLKSHPDFKEDDRFDEMVQSGRYALRTSEKQRKWFGDLAASPDDCAIGSLAIGLTLVEMGVCPLDETTEKLSELFGVTSKNKKMELARWRKRINSTESLTTA